MTRLITLALSILFSVSVFSQMPDNSTPVLKATDVERFIKHFPSLQNEFNKANFEFDADDDISELMEVANEYAEVNKMVQKYGYTDYAEFALQTWAIAACYASVKMEDEGMPNVNEAIAEIEKDENMTAEQKQMAIQQLQAVYSALGTSITSMANEQDITLVKKYIKELDSVFDED